MAEKPYKVVIALTAQVRYQKEVLPYLLQYFSANRAVEIDESIADYAKSLARNPKRGTLEKYLKNKKYNFRFILFRETRNLVIKIIYYVDESAQKVFVTDFFPVLMNPRKMDIRG